jgi:N-acetylglucosaminyldiphosphoundecaprenol N-acetyl-beta-D-mannosaminyltransferase
MKEAVNGEEEVLEKIPVLSLMVNTISLSGCLGQIMEWGISHKPAYVCFANVHMLAEAHRDERFRQQVNKASLVLPDGMPIVMTIRKLNGKKIERIAGMDFLDLILPAAAEKKARVFLYGSTGKILEGVVKRIQSQYPDIQIAGTISPTFGEQNDIETNDHINQINESGAHIVLISLGCPKQEKWMAENSCKISAVLLGLGGAFPVYAGMRKRAPVWMQRFSLEWLYRLIQEPRRMFGRYFYTNSLFLYLLTKKIFRR